MREIKFRVWDNVDYMTEFTLEDLQSRKVGFTKDCKVMQYTGLKDKNGKEIYEGDILEKKCIDNHRVCICQTHQYTNSSINQLTFVEIYNKERELSKPCNTLAYKAYEVIGNIYENPELINKQQ